MNSSLRSETTAQYGDVVGPAIAAQGLFQIFLFKPWHGFDDPFALAPRTLALMHGPVFVATTTTGAFRIGKLVHTDEGAGRRLASQPGGEAAKNR